MKIMTFKKYMESKIEHQAIKKQKGEIRRNFDKNSVSSRRSQRDSSSSISTYEANINQIIENIKEEMKNETSKVFQMYDDVYERHISQLEQARKQIRINTHTTYLAMKERHISELTDLELDHIFEREKANQHPCVKENQLKLKAQTFARIKNLDEAFRLREEAKKVASLEKESRIKAVDQKYHLIFQRLENKQKGEIEELQDQLILSMESAQASTKRLILNLQKKTVSKVKTVLSREIAKCRREVKDQSKNHMISRTLTDCMNEKIYADNKVGIFLAVQ